jgi:hypothetical protein
MKKIYDNDGNILHLFFRGSEAVMGREDLVEDKETLQCSTLRFGPGKKFKAHKHILKEVPKINMAQESWCVIRGKVLVYYYDRQGTLLDQQVLGASDISITLLGGHSYEILDEDTLVYEFKTGPYYSNELDKEYFYE